tara:strand:- start:884 stop:1345 length:462 start_codon:yes stop_codon:yes gene_type:complete
MKLRLDYVTNSSSSSYICDVCGREESGWDLSMSEIGMYGCQYGHYFCDDEIVRDFDKKAWVFSMLDEHLGDEAEEIKAVLEDDPDGVDDEASEFEFRYECPVEACPICQFETLTTGDIASYLLKKHKHNRAELKAELQSRFKSYAEFMSHLRS